MSYKILRNWDGFDTSLYSIVPIRDKDKFNIMQWRNEQMDILRQNEPLTAEMQSEYFEKVVKADFEADRPRQVLVSYLRDGVLIGYGGLVHIHWIDRRAEVSFLLETHRNKSVTNFKLEYSIFLSLIKGLAFDVLQLNKLTTEAFDLRPFLIETLEANGFVLEGRLRNHNFINGKFIDSLLHGCFTKGL